MISDLLARCTFPPAGTKVDCAVSGGPDSLALLVLACESGCEVTAWHVDHGLRPNSAAEAEVVAQAAARWGAAFEARTAQCEPGPNLEARARQARYRVLPEGVLTGHTADDQAETVLLNLMRGAGLDGLAGIDPARRPLLALRRSETQALCGSLDLEPVQDPSNLDPAHRRNRIRHEMLPLLCDIAEPRRGTDHRPRRGADGPHPRPARRVGRGHRPHRRQSGGRGSRTPGPDGAAAVDPARNRGRASSGRGRH